MDLVDVGVVISTPLQRSAFSIMLMYRRSALAAREHCSVQTRFLTTVTKLDRMMLRAASGSGAGEKHVLRWVDAASGLSSDLPHARAGASITRYTFGAYDLMYLFGGCGEVGCFDDLKRYDQKTNRWISPVISGKPPSKRKGHTMTLLGGPNDQHLLVWGGWGGDGPVSPSLKAFDVTSASWEVPATAGTPPTARWAHTAFSPVDEGESGSSVPLEDLPAGETDDPGAAPSSGREYRM